ncbi:2-hydroxyacid dehydrogenase [Lampropedia puyangensis]|uniref:2-hydroxyacid dehydrogenase n=1 Tax=Lampropedia puyangensis TaxID=1330072 RepID=A0A4S8FCJ5_9BURK|nr:NAD(P)-dependent oxidoreductase [Lampropedia puyangensis]THU05270.1 2-hydroxyacid dehydrogenase [Lampropedia puyangensis]
MTQDTSAPLYIPILGPWLAQELCSMLPAPFKPLDVHANPDYAGVLATHADTIRVVICSTGGISVNAQLMDQLPHLALILNLGAGAESVDMAEAARRNIQVLTGAGINAVDVAELAIGMMIALARRIHLIDQEVRQMQWGRDRQPVRRLAGRRAGIAGIGAIGQALAKRLDAMDMQVHYFSRTAHMELPWQHHTNLLSLAAEVDILFLALPGGTATHHLVGADVLQALGKDGFLINVGRGSVVDEAALKEALNHNHIAGAALDVFEHEPHVPSGLIASNQTLLQSHRGGFTVEAHTEVLVLTLQRLQHAFSL